MNTPKTDEHRRAATEAPVCSTLSNTSAVVSPKTEGKQWAGSELDGFHGQLVTCCLDELRPHPSYARHHITVPACQLSALTDLGDLVFREPIVITRDRIIIDGYARVELARIQDRLTLPCSEYQLTEVEALRWLLQRHRRSNGLNAFSRILLALELELDFKERARSNQQAGGQNKGSSKLTEAERLDVRSAIAAAAGVSVGNVTKVKQLTMTAHPELLKALHTGEIRIHRAWLWSKASPEEQKETLRLYRSQRGVQKTIRTLLSQHRPKKSSPALDPSNLVMRLSALEPGALRSISASVLDLPGMTVFVTRELEQSLQPCQEVIPQCATSSH
jgi:hypothetical protein